MMKIVTRFRRRDTVRPLSARGINSNIVRIRVNESTHYIYLSPAALSNLFYIQKKIIHINR